MHQGNVKHVFSLSGNQIMPIYDALLDHQIPITHTRHESAAVFMAEAYSQISGATGIALVTAAPGFANAIPALYTAAMSEVPLILLSGDSPRDQDQKGAFQEFDQVAAAQPFTKKSFRLSCEDDPAEVFAMAESIANAGVPGPVHIALPFDINIAQFDTEVIDNDAMDDFSSEYKVGALTTGYLENLKKLLSEAERPILLAGPHLFRGDLHPYKQKLSDALNVPILVLDSPRGLRDPASGAIGTTLQQADLLFYLGKPVDFTSGMAQNQLGDAQRIAAVTDSVDRLSNIAERFGAQCAFGDVASPREVVQQLLNDVDQKAQQDKVRNNWRSAVSKAIAHRELAVQDPEALHSKSVAEQINQQLEKLDDPIFICDGGEIGQWVQGFAQAKTRITNGPSGAIGASLPYAIGAAVAAPDRTVIALMGDGTAGFHLAELETAGRINSNITVIIGNDSRWNAEHTIQINSYGEDRAYACDLLPQARYDITAQSLGCEGELVTDITDFQSALEKAVGSNGPHCLNVIIPGAPAPQYTTFVG